MNFDDIQSAWNNENAGDKMNLPANLEKLKSAKMPIDKIRHTMKCEFYVQMLAVLFIGFVPLFIAVAKPLMLAYYLLYIVFFLICAYFFTKFVISYKNLSNNMMTSKDNLYAVYYDMRLNIELYKAFTYCLIPFAAMMAGIILIGSQKISIDALLVDIFHITKIKAILIVLVVVGGVLLTAWMTETWIKRSYGKYAAEVKHVLDEFTEA
ncbi:MAG: hypothetical protein JO154_09595 [Chitinophaga sp.]|uniref:hypothetical protein n=1 Tax=Chitinophaga sp. TaxID=1869181 RepID=UPI0025B7DBFB|nr:hypothetical protein [Chitinophaga sp.]MBV8252844.1 hypothetical protein [Chitinophaga sp.]